jgi:hypothetical protein
MTSSDEQQIIGKLISPPEQLFPFPTMESARAEACTVIRVVCKCSEEEAREYLQRLEDQGLIDLTMSPGGELHDSPMPPARFGWGRP